MYGINTTLSAPFDKAVHKVSAVLRNEGFGVPGDSDLPATLKQKLGVDFARRIASSRQTDAGSHGMLGHRLERCSVPCLQVPTKSL